MDILLIEDDSQISELLERFLRRKGHVVISCDDGEAGLVTYKEKCFPIVICDIVMPRMTGIDFLKAIAGLPHRADSSVLLITAHANVEWAITALKLGAYDFFTKPINLVELTAVLERITAMKQMTEELAEHREHLETLIAERTEELKAALNELQAAGATLTEQAQLLNIAHDYIMVRDLDNRILYWNQGAEKGYGFSVDEVKGQVSYELLKTQFSIPLEDIMNSIFKKGYWEGEIVNTHKNGKQIIVHSNQTLKRDDMGKPVSILGIHHDVTTQKKADAEFARLDRLNIIGEMAASIGHEVRNPMTMVKGYLQWYSKKDAFIAFRESFTLMIEELDRANSIITDFLSLAKDKRIDLVLTDLNKIIRSVLPLLQADAFLRGNDIELELENTLEIFIDEKEIRQCILNLVNNGLDSMPNGGKVTISTKNVGDQVIMTVRDKGQGMTAEVKAKLWTPFFTTKDHGTGLGLPVCYQIAQRHEATIEVETSPEGTAFHFIFSHKKILS